MFKYWYNIIHNRVKLAVLLVIVAIFIGVTGYSMIENMPIIDALYMVVITISTVRYGEVTALSEPGKIFTIALIITYLGIFTFFLTVVSTYIFDGEFRKNLNKKKMQNKINKFRDHVIVIGYGRNGKRCCEELENNKVRFVCIEKKQEAIDQMKENNYHYLEGDATMESTLEMANIRNAKALITTLPTDADNVYVVLTARKLCPNIDITSRANELSSESILQSAGANHVVMPAIIGGHYMANLVSKPHVIDFYNLLTKEVDSNIQTEGLHFDFLKPEFRDKSIESLGFRKRTGVNIIAMQDKTGKFKLNPNPELIFEENTTLIALGSREQLDLMNNIYTKK